MTASASRRRAALLLAAMPLLAACPGQDLSSLEPPAPPPLPEAVPPPDLAAPPPADAPPVATFSATVQRGQTVTRASLDLAGQRRPMILAGLAAEDAPGPRTEVAGRVFNLSRIEDLAGRYTLVGTGAAIAEMAMEGGLTLGNPQGVVLRLRPAARGPTVLTLPQGAITVTLGR